jgi:hypothetical protein
MAAPVSFRERSDSFPLHCGRRPYEQERLDFSIAIGGAADMDGRAAQPETDANDPLQTLDVQCNRRSGCRLASIHPS